MKSVATIIASLVLVAGCTYERPAMPKKIHKLRVKDLGTIRFLDREFPIRRKGKKLKIHSQIVDGKRVKGTFDLEAKSRARLDLRGVDEGSIYVEFRFTF